MGKGGGGAPAGPTEEGIQVIFTFLISRCCDRGASKKRGLKRFRPAMLVVALRSRATTQRRRPPRPRPYRPTAADDTRIQEAKPSPERASAPPKNTMPLPTCWDADSGQLFRGAIR